MWLNVGTARQILKTDMEESSYRQLGVFLKDRGEFVGLNICDSQKVLEKFEESEALANLQTTIQIFWDVAQCQRVKGSRSFEKSYCLYLQVRGVRLLTYRYNDIVSAKRRVSLM
jgi:deoxyinosine 3'endonuclease (endonuclease V)